MRTGRAVTSEEERFRVEPIAGARAGMIRRDPVEPEPVGTIVLMAFRVTGYAKDCDGSLMARLEHIDRDGEPSGWEPQNVGLYPTTNLVVTQEEWRGMFDTPNSLPPVTAAAPLPSPLVSGGIPPEALPGEYEADTQIEKE